MTRLILLIYKEKQVCTANNFVDCSLRDIQKVLTHCIPTSNEASSHDRINMTKFWFEHD